MYKLNLHKTKIIDYSLAAACFAMTLFVVFELGVYVTQKSHDKQITQAELNAAEQERLSQEISRLNEIINSKEQELSHLQSGNEDYAFQQKQLLDRINELRGKVAGLSTSIEEKNGNYPFIAPATGIAASENGLFGGTIGDMDHLGIDIWATTANNGMLPNHKGNPVYAACNGKVVGFDEANGGVTISCDQIEEGFNVPKKKVYTHYSHLGNGVTKGLYFTVTRNQRVSAGDLLGYQGDLSRFFPEMRNVHLHFSVFTGNSETDPNGGAINPCLYIGGNCQKRGEMFYAKK